MQGKANKPESSQPESGIFCMLFCDVSSFSTVASDPAARFVEDLFTSTARFLEQAGDDVVYRNTWGDAVFCVFRKPVAAADVALQLRDHFRHNDFKTTTQQSLGIRVSLHAGEIRWCVNAVTGKKSPVGANVNFAARIEPITPVGHVFATETFRSTLQTSDGHGRNFAWDCMEQCYTLPKGGGQCKLWNLRFESDPAPPVAPITDIITMPSTVIPNKSPISVPSVFLSPAVGHSKPPLLSDESILKQLEAQARHHHTVIHKARDLAVSLMKPFTKAESLSLIARAPALDSLKVFSDGRNSKELQLIIDAMAHYFEPLVPSGTRIWTSLRARGSDECYHTIVRAGLFNPNREFKTTGLHKKDSPVVTELRESFEGHNEQKHPMCVIITGNTQANIEAGRWDRNNHNNHFGEDKSVLMGLVALKSWGRDEDMGRLKILNRMHMMIVSVCADAEDVFKPSHMPIMQCFVDTLGTLVNVMVRSEMGWM